MYTYTWKERAKELNSRLASILVEKGVEASVDETTTSLINKVNDISVGESGSDLISLITGGTTDLIIPDGITYVRSYAFYGHAGITSAHIPDSVTVMGQRVFHNCKNLSAVRVSKMENLSSYAFCGCSKLTEIELPEEILYISSNAFQDCTSLERIVYSSLLKLLGTSAFQGCSALKEITIPASITTLGSNVFKGCAALEYIYLGNGFNRTGLDLSDTDLPSDETVKNMGIAYEDRTGLTALTLTISQAVYDKLSDETKTVFTNKNITLVVK